MLAELAVPLEEHRCYTDPFNTSDATGGRGARISASLCLAWDSHLDMPPSPETDQTVLPQEAPSYTDPFK